MSGRCQSSLEQKLDRLSRGESPRVLDLFCGCGGLSLGFDKAGFEIVGGIDIDSDATASHELNFPTSNNNWSRTAGSDVRRLGSLVRNHPRVDLVDVIVGGPPCPTFSRIGRAKLREIWRHDEAHLIDPRGSLWTSFLEIVESVMPLVVLIENVPGILNHGGRNLGETICNRLSRLGFDCGYTILNAVNYGVPQFRERFFLLGVQQRLKTGVAFPLPTHRIEIPRGYGELTRMLKAGNSRRRIHHGDHLLTPPSAPANAEPAVTVEEAIGDLPRIEGSVRLPGRTPNGLAGGRCPTASEYTNLMRRWLEITSSELDPLFRVRGLTARDVRIFRRMKQGDDYPEAKRLAERMFREVLMRRIRSGTMAQGDVIGRAALRARYVPPYDSSKFPNKWWKMIADSPSRTLTAHLGKDSYSHIHFDSSQGRVLSVREAARLQSFPDGFKFAGGMNSILRQIGNAVPPLLAYAVAVSVRGALQRAASSFQRRLRSGRRSINCSAA